MAGGINHLKNDVPDFGWLEMLKAFLFFYNKWKKKYFFFLLIALLTFFYTTAVPVFIIGKIVDFFANFKAGDSLNYFYAIVIILGATMGTSAVIRLTAKRILNNIQSEVIYFVRVRGFERLLDFSIKWHDKENSGNKVQKIQNGTDALGQLQRMLQNDIIITIAYLGGILIFFAFSKIFFFLFSLLYLVIFLAIQATFYKKQLELQNEYNTQLEKASGTYYEGLSNVLTIKTLGVKEDFKQNIIGKEELSRDFFKKITKLGTSKWTVFQIANAFFISGFLLMVGHDFLTKNLTLGSIFVYTNYFMNITLNVGQSTNIFDQLINFKISIGRMMPIYWEKSLAKEGHLDFPKTWNEINLTNAYFDYKEKTDKELKESALNNINLLIKKFEKIGIVGKSGSGKSTLAKIFLGLYEFDKGDFKIEQTNFYDIKHEEITENISLVLQDSEMFNLSLKDNITLMRKFNERLFEQAIEIAQLKELIEKLPDGLETLIGEKGYRLSGGERQRIGIARAIYKDPQILVLDEATSSLDTKTEGLIQNAIETKLDKKTIIIIAHRISTLKNVDKIYVFENGEIAEEGEFDKLSADKNSKFYDLSKLQQSQNNI